MRTDATATHRKWKVLSCMGVANVATPERIVDHNGLSREQINLIQQFEADFNVVDHFLRVALDREEHVGFMGIPVKVNIDSGGKPNGIPERR
jgi:hypothetical protein